MYYQALTYHIQTKRMKYPEAGWQNSANTGNNYYLCNAADSFKESDIETFKESII